MCHDFNPRTHRGVRLSRKKTPEFLHYFNPRTHRGVRHIGTDPAFKKKLISIHAPIVGCDHSTIKAFTTSFEISIHAPIVGCDYPLGKWNYGVIKFQSTHPSWGATNCQTRSVCIQKIFQSTHPSWGATGSSSFISYSLTNFNPRTHRGVRRHTPLEIDSYIYISIHAPIVGCDWKDCRSCL